MNDELLNDGMMDKKELMRRLEEDTKVFKNPAVKAAFEAIDRRDFVGDDYSFEAYEDYPLPTKNGQTISQPTTVAFMLELLDPQKGDHVLDIGSGSGWTSVLLGHIVGKDGKVVGTEIQPELVEQGRNNLKKYKDLPVEIMLADKEAGMLRKGPYNRILGGAAFKDKNDQSIAELLLQLLSGGVMVVPAGDSIFKFEKKDDDEYFETEYPGFAFVPYV